MKSLIRIIKFNLGYKKYISGIVFFNLLSSFFGLFSFILLAPLLDVIFNKTDDYYIDLISKPSPVLSFSTENFIDLINYKLANLIVLEGKVYTLLTVCMVIGMSVLLKNLFIYLSSVLVSLLVNKSVGDIRNNIFTTLMHLPVAYLSDEKKGEVISKISNDVQEIEWSIQSAIKGVFKEPINILVFLGSLFAMSLELSLFIVIFLPLSGFLISAVSKSLKKNTKSAQEYFGNLLAH